MSTTDDGAIQPSNPRSRHAGASRRRSRLELNRNQWDLRMVRPCEILFVDPSVSDLDTIFRCLRPEVEAIVLDAESPPARQIATALAGRAGLDAVHVIAHGAPGLVSFVADDWSTETLEDEAD